MSIETMWFIFWGICWLGIIAACCRNCWLQNYHDKYNEHYADAKRRGTVGKFRNTQFNP